MTAFSMRSFGSVIDHLAPGPTPNGTIVDQMTNRRRSTTVRPSVRAVEFRRSIVWRSTILILVKVLRQPEPQFRTPGIGPAWREGHIHR